ncbi:MAG: HD domain-containing protein [Pirellulales bacterium]|nr:HD domain-containing protein [Pirellulales bacterium]
MSHPTTLAVLELFRRRGNSQYGREAVTQLEHALQAAMFAERDGADASLITAALLHDVGHLLHALPNDAPEQGIDDHHETAAAIWLNKRFGPDVVEPVRLHVAAKRYLCTVEPEYREVLSGPSLVSLELQGGLLSDGEREEFESSVSCAAAVLLRRWDDAAKVVGLATPPLEHFAQYVDGCAR